MALAADVKIPNWDGESEFVDFTEELTGKIMGCERTGWSHFWDGLGVVLHASDPDSGVALREAKVMAAPESSTFSLMDVEPALIGHLAEYGEILPVKSVGSGKIWIFHCTYEVDVLDRERSEGLGWGMDGAGEYIYKYRSLAFREAGLRALEFFRIPQLRAGSCFITSVGQKMLNDAVGPDGLGVRFKDVRRW